MTELLHFHFSLSNTGERNSNPLQCSCLENPRDGGARWSAVYRVAQKQLSSSSSNSLFVNVVSDHKSGAVWRDGKGDLFISLSLLLAKSQPKLTLCIKSSSRLNSAYMSDRYVCVPEMTGRQATCP